MRSNEIRRLMWSSLLAGSLFTVGITSPSYAQTQDPATTQSTDYNNEDDGTDWGWIGLLGLAGLLGLRRRDHHVDRVERVDRVDTSRTTRP